MSGIETCWVDILKGAGLALAVAAPIGPTAMLCIQGTIRGGVPTGLAIGYGAATTHTVYGSIAAAGLSMVQQAVGPWAVPLQAFGGLFILYVAVKTFRLDPALCQPGRTHRRSFLTGLFWTSGNPMTLLGFFAIGPGILGSTPYAAADLPLVATGVLLGSGLWWTAMTLGINAVRARLNDAALRMANLLTGSALAFFALCSLARTVGWTLPG